MSGIKRRSFIQSLGATAFAPLFPISSFATPGMQASESEVEPPVPRFTRESEAILFSDMSQSEPSGALDRKRVRNKWHLMDYEAEDLRGTMVYACDDMDPVPDLTLSLNATGWHAIYLGFYAGFPSMGGAEFKLSDDANFRRFLPQFTKEVPSIPEHVQEGFWKCADLTGKSLVFRKFGSQSNVSHVKLVPMTEEEVEALHNGPKTKRWELVAVCDGEGWFERATEGSKEEIHAEIEPYCDADFGKLVWQSQGPDPVMYPSKVADLPGEGVTIFPVPWMRHEQEMVRKFIENGINELQEAIAYGHSRGLEVHIGCRHGCFAATEPLNEYYTSRFYLDHPELRCIDREGKSIARLSYAFEPVQRFLLDLVEEWSGYGTDGVTLIFNRGVPVMLYEKPLTEGFQAKYGRDPKTLPPDDSQWLDYLASQVTDWMRGVRRTLDKKAKELRKPKLQLSCWAMGSASQNRLYGLDIRAWAQEGIMDFIMSRGDAYLPNQTDGIGNYDPAVVSKYFADAVRGTKCKFYYDVMPREMSSNDYRKKAQEAYSNGADGLAFWDTDDRYKYLDMFAAVSRLGHEAELNRSTATRVRLAQMCNKIPVNPYPTWWVTG